MLSVVKEVKPHVLIGTSTKPGAFTQEIVQEMAKHVERPIIFPLSNPTKLHEAKPQDLFNWTEGKVLVATGSPFSPAEYNGKKYEVGKQPSPAGFPTKKLTCDQLSVIIPSPSLVLGLGRSSAVLVSCLHLF